MKKRNIDDLVRVYHDLEKTLQVLRKSAEKNFAHPSVGQIDVRKLIARLSASKRKLRRKIGNTILLEKQSLKKRIKEFTSNLSHTKNET
jgi:hypothetical protein